MLSMDRLQNEFLQIQIVQFLPNCNGESSATGTLSMYYLRISAINV